MSTWRSEAAGDPIVVAVATGDGARQYGWPVRFLVSEEKADDYEAAAEFINASPADVVSIQHEFGIFGGPEGTGLRRLLRRARKPVITTLHTVLPEPHPTQRDTIRALAEGSERLVVMNALAADILRKVYDVDSGRVAVIHHGAPKPSRQSRAEAKRQLGLAGRKVLSTFGLVGPGKGLQYAVAALPAIRERHPDVCYVIVGKTHPGVQRSHRETYREELKSVARELRVEDAVRFVNSYQTEQEIVRSLAATDVYLTPYLNPEQICSGTLAYAVAAGKAVVSTPYLYAQFLLAEGRGRLVAFRSPDAIAEAVSEILDHPELQRTLEERALRYGRQLYWPVVGERFMKVCEAVSAGPALLMPRATKRRFLEVEAEGGERDARGAGTTHVAGPFAATH